MMGFRNKNQDMMEYQERNIFSVIIEQQQMHNEGSHFTNRNSANHSLQASCQHIWHGYRVIAIRVIAVLLCNGLHLST